MENTYKLLCIVLLVLLVPKHTSFVAFILLATFFFNKNWKALFVVLVIYLLMIALYTIKRNKDQEEFEAFEQNMRTRRISDPLYPKKKWQDCPGLCETDPRYTRSYEDWSLFRGGFENDEDIEIPV